MLYEVRQTKRWSRYIRNVVWTWPTTVYYDSQVYRSITRYVVHAPNEMSPRTRLINPLFGICVKDRLYTHQSGRSRSHQYLDLIVDRADLLRVSHFSCFALRQGEISVRGRTSLRLGISREIR